MFFSNSGAAITPSPKNPSSPILLYCRAFFLPFDVKTQPSKSTLIEDDQTHDYVCK